MSSDFLKDEEDKRTLHDKFVDAAKLLGGDVPRWKAAAGEKMGISRGYMHHLVSGLRPLNQTNVDTLAEALQVEASALRKLAGRLQNALDDLLEPEPSAPQAPVKPISKEQQEFRTEFLDGLMADEEAKLRKETTVSLGQRVQAFLAEYGPGNTWSGSLDDQEQRALFGVSVPQAVAIHISQDDHARIRVKFLRDGGSKFMLPLADIQQMSEEAGRDPQDDEDPLVAPDGYRTFDRAEASVAVVENTRTGFRYEMFARPNQDVLELFAKHEGYSSWREMRWYGATLDMDEHWTVTWALEMPDERTS